MSYQHLPDAPESVKYHGGYDPSDPPQCDDERCPECDRINCICPDEKEDQ